MTRFAFTSGLHRTGPIDLVALAQAGKHDGWHVFLLPRSIRDRVDFFEAVRATIPLDPPLVGNRVWDALSDSLFGGLLEREARQLMIVWPNTPAMESLSRRDFEIALAVLADVARALQDEAATQGQPKELVVYVE